jgi:hypothetical protein
MAILPDAISSNVTRSSPPVFKRRDMLNQPHIESVALSDDCGEQLLQRVPLGQSSAV